MRRRPQCCCSCLPPPRIRRGEPGLPRRAHLGRASCAPLEQAGYLHVSLHCPPPTRGNGLSVRMRQRLGAHSFTVRSIGSRTALLRRKRSQALDTMLVSRRGSMPIMGATSWSRVNLGSPETHVANGDQIVESRKDAEAQSENLLRIFTLCVFAPFASLRISRHLVCDAPRGKPASGGGTPLAPREPDIPRSCLVQSERCLP